MKYGWKVMCDCYKNNRMWGDGVAVALWYALQGSSFGTAWRARLEREIEREQKDRRTK